MGLLKELTATQGVVERKTTIPILSNFRFSTVTGLESSPISPRSLPG
jgi:hypothetical protein